MKKHPIDGAHGRARILRRDMTAAERKVWQMLRARQISGYRFRRQIPIGRYIVDFACHEAGLIIEVDGGQHDPALKHEARRTKSLEGEGYRVLRFWNNDVLQNPEGVYAAIANDLLRHPHPRRDASHPPPSRGRV